MTQPDTKSAEPFVPLPDEWADAPVCILGALGSCDDCCTRATDGDLCGPCTEKYEAIANVLRHFIRAAAPPRVAETGGVTHTPLQGEGGHDGNRDRRGRTSEAPGRGTEADSGSDADVPELLAALRHGNLSLPYRSVHSAGLPLLQGREVAPRVAEEGGKE